MPPYISWLRHGEVSASVPASFTDARAMLFGVEASRVAMQGLVDTFLNQVGYGTVSYVCPVDMALISFMDIARSTSIPENIGWLPSRECALWVPLFEFQAGAVLPDRIVMWAPYIFINNAIGMATGREVWGWPKTLATITVASDAPAAPAHFACDTGFFQTFDASLPMVQGTLFGIDGMQPLTTVATWNTGQEAFQAICDGLLDGITAALIDVLGAGPKLPAVVLKQFRDSADPSLACFQALVNSPIMITNFAGGGPLHGSFTLTITTCESCGIVADFFGVPPQPGSTTIPVAWAGWVDFDFAALPGNTIVQRT